jgi:hypothetical protein
MAIEIINKTGGAFPVTRQVGSSADHAALPNNCYFEQIDLNYLVRYKDATGAIVDAFSAAAGGLTYFTEAQNTSAPNATVYVDSLTALSSTTDADISIVPKGTGAFQLSVPDNTTVGGNKRGLNSVDLQTASRSSANQVASGNYVSLLGGYRNRATGNYSVIAGNQNLTSGQSSVALGESLTASAIGSIALGVSCTSSGSYSFSSGLQSTATNSYAVAMGYSCTASGQSSVSFGASNNISGTSGFGAGGNNTNSGNYSAVFGFSNSISGMYTIRAGYGNTGNAAYSVTTGYNNVVSGSENGCFGSSSTVSANYGFSLGYQNSVTGLYGLALGKACTSSLDSATAIGLRCKATGETSLAIGGYFYSDSTASGGNSIIVGFGTANSSFAQVFGSGTCDAPYSTVLGYQGHAFGLTSKVSICTNIFTSAGDSQKGIARYGRRTTDATVSTLTANGNPLVNQSTILGLQNQQMIRFKGSITGKQSGSTNVGVWDIDGVIVRGANAASTTLVGTPTITAITNISGWGTPTITADTSNGALKIDVQGLVGTNIQWLAILDTVENLYL